MQGGIKYHFQSLWYDWTIGEHSTHKANGRDVQKDNNI